MEIEQHIEINAKPEVVYKALTQNIRDWWGRPYIIDEDSNDLILEPKIGGLLYEKGENGVAYKWGEVTYLKNNEILEITGPFGLTKAIYGKVCYTLKGIDDGTRVQLTHRAYGDFDEGTKDGYTVGWKDLISLRLKKLVEENIKMGFGNEPSMEDVMKQIS